MSIQILTKSGIHNPRIFRIRHLITIVLLTCTIPCTAQAQRPSAPAGGQPAVVVDERLAVVRDGPSLSARYLKRLSRGRLVSLLGSKRSPDGIIFYSVAVTSRTRGWLQREAVISSARKGDDERLLSLIRASREFDRLARASIFIETFRRSAFRPAVLLLLGSAAEDAAKKLTNEANRRLDEADMKGNPAPMKSYFINYSGLDRYQRLGIEFLFDEAAKKYRYNGMVWREIVRRYPRSAEAIEARQRLAFLGSGIAESSK